MNDVSVWNDGNRRPDYMVPVRNIQMREWLMSVTVNPVRLTMICRSTILGTMGYITCDYVESLPLPRSIKNYLLLYDIEDMMLQTETDEIFPSLATLALPEDVNASDDDES